MRRAMKRRLTVLCPLVSVFGPAGRKITARGPRLELGPAKSISFAGGKREGDRVEKE